MRGSLRTARWPSSCRAHLVFAPIMKMFTRDGDYHHCDVALCFYHRAHYDFQSPGLCSDYKDVPIHMVMIIIVMLQWTCITGLTVIFNESEFALLYGIQDMSCQTKMLWVYHHT